MSPAAAPRTLTAPSPPRRAFADGRWSAKTPEARKEVLLRLAALLRDHTEEFALLDTLDMGKPITETLTGDVPGAAAFLQWHAEAIDKIYDEVAPTGGRDVALIRRIPLGVVGAVVPWNCWPKRAGCSRPTCFWA